MKHQILTFFLLVAGTASAGDRFRYYVFDETKTAKLDYEHVHDFTIYDFAGQLPHLMFSTEYRISGCAQDRFTYTVERCERDIPRERFQKFLAAIRALPLKTLDSKEPRANETEGTYGWLTLDDSDHAISARLHDPNRVKLHTLVLTFLDEIAPKASRTTTTRTIEGDLVPARAVSFAALLRNPQPFDGKRIRLTGYYHGQFEGSNFGPTKRADYQESVWLGGVSTFATSGSVKRLNDTFITADGTFDLGPGGHMGLWPGELTRLTRRVKAKP